MLIKTNTMASIEIKTAEDLPKLKYFMECNNLKINKSQVARQLNMDRRTIHKYLNGYEKTKTRNKPSYLNCYYDKINNRVNCTLNKGSGRIPIMDFEIEKDSLLPLPHEKIRNQYRIKTKSVKVNSSSMISVKTNFYSVPKEYIGKKVQYQIIDSIIHIYYNTNLISLHKISENKLNYLQNDYESILSCKFKNKNEEEIKEMLRKI